MSISPAQLRRSWSMFHVDLFGDELPKQWEEDVAGFMFERRYHAQDARRVLAYAAEFGSVEGCPVFLFDDNDRRVVESKLPSWPGNWSRPEYDGTWTITEAPAEATR